MVKLIPIPNDEGVRRFGYPAAVNNKISIKEFKVTYPSVEESAQCSCVCHVSSNKCCELCATNLVKSIHEALELLNDFYENYGGRLKVIEDLFAGKSFKPIHDAMELHVERFDNRIDSLESSIGIINGIIKPRQEIELCLEDQRESLDKCFERIEILENQDYLEQLEGFNRLSENIEIIEGHLFSDGGVIERIEKLESVVELAFKVETFKKDFKTPHKCPVCDGNGRVSLDKPLVKDNATFFSISCVPCKEEGIVWG